MLSGEILGPIGTGNPLLQATAVTGLLALLSFVAGLITNDHSWTDRMWSIAPVGLAWLYAAAADWDIRVVIAACLITLWGVRLTLNFARRGGYSGVEDYRWKILQKQTKSSLLWQLFHLTFIAGFQHFLFVAFTVPLYVLYLNAGQHPTIDFWAIAAAFLGFLVLETAADQQQWRFQQRKAAGVAHDDDVRRGFRTTGLFRYMRHPNYLGELGVWWCVYFWGAASAGVFLHWSIAGPILLTILFIASTWFTERITVSRYPEYPAYRRRTWAFIPKYWGKSS